MNIEDQVNKIVDQVLGDITDKIQKQVMDIVAKQIKEVTDKIDYQMLVRNALTAAIQQQKLLFPDKSIPVRSVDMSGCVITGDQVQGGIIKKFGSTGIDDQATTCQLTIMDAVTVVENDLVTKDLTIKGRVNIEGELNITGPLSESSALFKNVVQATANTVRSGLNQVFFSNYADLVFQQIKNTGLDLAKITNNGQTVIEGNTLGKQIIYSNIQKLGLLKELEVEGESFLNQTLYVTNKRVGINTIEPAQALSIWDQEIEIGIGKKEKDIGVIGTTRGQALSLSSNNKNNILLTPDGGVTVNQLTLGAMTISASPTPPSDNRPWGTLIFNSNPTLGGPLGWISLGEARWANFGFID